MRAETGPMRFEDDYCGVFIRGDNASAFALVLTHAANGDMREITQVRLRNLAKLLFSCDENKNPQAQSAALKVTE